MNADICDANGECDCQENVEGEKCTTCTPGHFNFPTCTGKLVAQIELQNTNFTKCFLSFQLVPVTHGELLTMLILVMTVVNVTAKEMLMVTSVTHVRMVTTTFQVAQVG